MIAKLKYTAVIILIWCIVFQMTKLSSSRRLRYRQANVTGTKKPGATWQTRPRWHKTHKPDWLKRLLELYGNRTFGTVKKNLEFFALSGVVFNNLETPKDDVWGEHYFGECASGRKNLLLTNNHTHNFMTRVAMHEDAECVYIRTRSPYPEYIRLTPLYFSFCIHHIIFIHHHRVYIELYYEFFKPEQSVNVKYEVSLYKRTGRPSKFLTPPPTTTVKTSPTTTNITTKSIRTKSMTTKFMTTKSMTTKSMTTKSTTTKSTTTKSTKTTTKKKVP